MDQVFFSIVIPTYNRAHIIKPSIQSILRQSFNNWELIVIDDGSTDNTGELVRSIADSRIRYYWQKNQERSIARNNGIKQATGQFICFLDSDDLWRDNHLETLYKKIVENNNKKAFYFTAMCWNFPDSKKNVIFEPIAEKSPVEYVITNQIGTPTVCIHSSILEKYQFNSALRINEDVELFARIASKYQLIRIPVVTVDVIVHDMNTKAQEKDYITPQINAMKVIFNNSELKRHISISFRRAIFQNLYHQLINHHERLHEYDKMNKAIVRFLIKYPTHWQNKSKLVLLVYHLPGGSLIKRLIRSIK